METHLTRNWWLIALRGIIAIAWPGITVLALLFVIAAWAIVTGILEVWAAIELREELRHEWLLALSGLAFIFFGLYVAIFTGGGALAITWLTGVYAIVFGVLFVMLDWRLRGWTSPAQPTMSGAK